MRDRDKSDGRKNYDACGPRQTGVIDAGIYRLGGRVSASRVVATLVCPRAPTGSDGEPRFRSNAYRAKDADAAHESLVEIAAATLCPGCTYFSMTPGQALGAQLEEAQLRQRIAEANAAAVEAGKRAQAILTSAEATQGQNTQPQIAQELGAAALAAPAGQPSQPPEA